MDKRLKEGLALFEQKHYFRCHEVIEKLWLETSLEDPYRDLYKGVIQAAAALYQKHRGVLSGAERLYESSMKYLEKYAPAAQEFNVDKFKTQLRVLYRGK